MEIIIFDHFHFALGLNSLYTFPLYSQTDLIRHITLHTINDILVHGFLLPTSVNPGKKYVFFCFTKPEFLDMYGIHKKTFLLKPVYIFLNICCD